MNCHRAYEIDLEDLLVAPESEAYREFAAHSEGCPDCAGELALQRGMLARLRDEDAVEAAHPADAALLQLARGPERLTQEERTRLRAHLRDCHPCDDAYRATLMLVPEPQRSPVARALETLRGWLVPVPARAWAPVALAMLLVVGVTWQLDPLGLREGSPELRYRSVPGEFAVEVEIAADGRGELSLYGVDAEDVVLLRIEVPPELYGKDVVARITPERGDVVIFEDPLGWDPERSESGFVEPPAGLFDPDSYRVEVVPGVGQSLTRWLDVR